MLFIAEEKIVKFIVLALLLVWAFISLPKEAAAQSPELVAALRKVKALKAQGNFSEAEVYAKKALDLGAAEFGPNHNTYATLLNNLAVLYYDQGRYADAEPYRKRALEIFAE